MKKISVYHIAVITLGAFIWFSGCKKGSESDGSPALPPEISISMGELKSFTSLKKSDPVTIDSSHFKMAYEIAHTWDSVIIKIINKPEALLKAALNGEKTYDKDKKQWNWTFIKALTGDGSYQATLSASLIGDSISWTLTASRINGDGVYKFKWLEGSIDTKQTGGNWMVYEPISKAAYLVVSWKKESDNTRWIKYTKISGDKQSSVKYGTSNNSAYNAYFNIFTTDDTEPAVIEWNTSTFEGRLIYNGNTYSWGVDLGNM